MVASVPGRVPAFLQLLVLLLEISVAEFTTGSKTGELETHINFLLLYYDRFEVDAKYTRTNISFLVVW